MAKSSPRPGKGTPKSRSTWVRKNMAMDQAKLTRAKKLLGVPTETEAVDAALDLIAFQLEIRQGIESLAALGPWGPASR